jgi:GTPase SAR1 family protein
MIRCYFREAKGAIIVFDQTMPRSFDSVLKWKMDLDENFKEQSIPVIILQNKCDMTRHPAILEHSDMVKWTEDHGIPPLPNVNQTLMLKVRHHRLR